MKIPVVYAMDNEGCAPRYTVAALKRLGHETQRLTPDEYVASNPGDYDLFFCQDSGAGIDFTKASGAHLKKTSMWYWDSRFNRVQRTPGDDDMAQVVSDGGGWVFQAQSPDIARLAKQRRLARMSWLPIAADCELWRDTPIEEKEYKLSFVGNCYDPGRGAALNYARENLGLYWPGANSMFYGDAAKLYRQSWVVFHAPTFYELPHNVTGERVDYDVTMRYYEAAACGAPVVTPPMTDFQALGFKDGLHVFIYRNLIEMGPKVEQAYSLAKDTDLSSALRRFVVERHTYEHRLSRAFDVLRSAGVLYA